MSEQQSKPNYILEIEYVHCDGMMYESGYALHEKDFENRSIKIPFTIFYPADWMKPLFDANQESIGGVCVDVVDSNLRLEHLDYNEWISYMTFDDNLKWGNPNEPLQYERVNGKCQLKNIKPINRKYYEDNLNNNFIECDQCYYATINYCDKIYNTMLNLINCSIYELMLCLKVCIKQKDMIQLIGKITWNTRHEVIWLKLNKI